MLKDEIEKITPQVKNTPTKEQIASKARLIKRTLRGVYTREGRLKKMTFEDKRKLAQSAFGGKDVEGRRFGVYVNKPDIQGGSVAYEIKGILEDFQGQLPSKKEDLLSKCHAHHGLCVYK